MAASIKDVAQLAGVSSATVSRVLAQKPHVREDVRQRVLQAVKKLGYQPSRVARSLRVRSSQIIGLIISDIQNPFFTALVRAVEDQAYAHQYAIFLCNSDENSHKEALYIDLMLAERVAGVILTPTRETSSPVSKLQAAGIPVVVVDRRIRDLELDTVVLDNIAAAQALASHLIDQGHRRIGAILASPAITTGNERSQGYTLALKEKGIPVDPALIRTGMPKEVLGYQFASELLDLPDLRRRSLPATTCSPSVLYGPSTSAICASPRICRWWPLTIWSGLRSSARGSRSSLNRRMPWDRPPPN